VHTYGGDTTTYCKYYTVPMLYDSLVNMHEDFIVTALEPK
jgi:hypothetical protein